MDHQAFAQLLGNYGEFVGSIAVLVTLVYLAIQVRQNTEQARDNAADIRQTGLGQIFEMHSKHRFFIASDIGNSRMVREGLADFEALEEDELLQFDHFMWDVAWTYIATWSGYKNGVLAKEVWDASLVDFVDHWIGQSGGLSWWRTTTYAFPSDFKAVVDRALEAN